jgi:methyl-accepting chemotaxis protein
VATDRRSNLDRIMSFILRLTIAQKLLLLGFLVLATVSVPLYLQLRLSQELIAAAEQERAGVEPARQLMKLVQTTQQHRGLSAAMLGGNASVQAGREAKRKEVDEVLGRLDAMLKHSRVPDELMSEWKSGTDGWQSLQQAVAGRGLAPADSSTQHAAVIAQYFKVLDLWLDHSGLILDPQADTYFLMTATLIKLPFATESLGQTRARGAGFLAEAKIPPQGRAMVAGLTQQSRDLVDGMGGAFRKAFAANPELKAALADKVQATRDPIAHALDLAHKEVVLPEQLTHAAPDYIAVFTKTIDGLFALEEASLAQLEAMLSQRVSHLRTTQYVQFGLLGLLLFGVAMLARQVVRSITQPLDLAVTLAERIAAGDLTGEAHVRGRDEIAKLMVALKRMKESLNQVVGNVRGNAESVATGSSEIAQGNADLSKRTEQQASSLEETASAMEELTSTVKQNAANAHHANQLAQEARDLALRGGQAVDQMIMTMKGIDGSSKKIADIIGVIDSIAFQTNILALNAAVEAARAGDQGRGFAVVASEVRLLAKRSADAAKEIKVLISASVEQVDAGSRVVQQSGETMQQAVEAIRRVAETIEAITTASQEQSQGIGQVSEAISHMDQLTQQNAALVEESAAAAESLQRQANRLSELVNTFKLDTRQPTESPRDERLMLRAA